MAYQHGENTKEIRIQGASTTPAPSRSTIRRHTRFGRRCFIAGTSSAIGLCITALVNAVIANNNMWLNPTSELLAALVFFGVMTTCAALISVGGREHVLHEIHAEQKAEIAAVIQEQLEPVIAAMRTTRNDVNEIHDFMGAVAKLLPGELDRANWKGFNAAVREGFVERTGTDSGRARPAHLGLVPKNRAEDN